MGYTKGITEMILASASPRRKALLEQIGIPFRVIVSDADETVASGLSPEEMVKELALRKAAAVTGNPGYEGGTILGADTVVAVDGKVLGKPGSPEEAVQMLSLLQNRSHMVYTGVAIVDPGCGRKHVFSEATRVTFTPMSRDEIKEYVATGDPMDKAGAYGIQGFCAQYIKRIEGDYNNVVGLPVSRLRQELNTLLRSERGQKAVVFDLDGTLSNSISSLAYSGNQVLSELGLKTFGEDDYKYFVGDGAENLVKRALIAAGDESLKYFEAAYRRYKEVFTEHCMDGVVPYQGICELLAELKKRNSYLAVLSNKPHAETIQVVETLFGKGVFDVIRGQMEDVPIKPSPEGVFAILDQLNQNREEGHKLLPADILYLGDTGTDMKTGRSAGAFTVGALWGFRKREELVDAGAELLAEHPLDILPYVCEG